MSQDCLMLLVKGSEAEATQALRDHGFDTTDYRVHKENTEVAFFIHHATQGQRCAAVHWFCEDWGGSDGATIPEGGLPAGTLLLYN